MPSPIAGPNRALSKTSIDMSLKPVNKCFVKHHVHAVGARKTQAHSLKNMSCGTGDGHVIVVPGDYGNRLLWELMRQCER